MEQAHRGRQVRGHLERTDGVGHPCRRRSLQDRPDAARPHGQHPLLHQLHHRLAQAPDLVHEDGHPEWRHVQRLDHTRFASLSRAGSSYARGVQLRANRDDEWASARWDFTLPAADPLRDAQVRGTRCGRGWLRRGLLLAGVEGEDESAYWLRRSYGWSSVSKPSAGASGRRASGLVEVSGDYVGRHDIAKVRLTYRYAVLR